MLQNIHLRMSVPRLGSQCSVLIPTIPRMQHNPLKFVVTVT